MGEDGFPERINAKADLWGIAGVIWDLMNSIRGRGIRPLRDNLMNEHNIHIDRSSFQNAPGPAVPRSPGRPVRYSTWLTDLVDECTHNNPEERPRIEEALEKITEARNNLESILGGRDLASLGPEMEGGSLKRQPDQFPVGKMLKVKRVRRRRP